MEHDNYIYRLINKFFNSTVTEEIKDRFGSWLASPHEKNKKDEAMKELWDNTPSSQEISWSDIEKLNKEIQSTSSRSILRRIGIAAAILIPILCMIGSWHYIQTNISKFKPTELAECFVPNGQKRELMLPDGSKVWLNSGSMLIYDKNMESTERTLFLNGEANFEVAKDPRRPFKVKTTYMTVEALGTIFCLNSYADQILSMATLEEGRIKVDMNDGQQFILNPDEQLSYNNRFNTIQLTKVNAERILKWRDGYINFQQASFDQIMHTLERRYDVSIIYEMKKYTGKSFTMKFSPDEGLQQVLDVMKEMIKGMNYKIKDNKVYIN